MNCLVGGPLLVGGLQGPGPPGLPLKSGRGSNALLPRSRHHSYRLWSLLTRLHSSCRHRSSDHQRAVLAVDRSPFTISDLIVYCIGTAKDHQTFSRPVISIILVY